MNVVTNEEIFNMLNAEYQNLLSNHEENSILGVFGVGDINKGKAIVPNDVKICAVVFPPLQDYATGCDFNIIKYAEKPTLIIPFPELFAAILRRYESIEEILSTKYFVVNPVYAKNFKQLQRKIDFSAEKISYSLTSLLHQNLSICNGEQDKLFKAITKTEERALIYILECIGDEGTISVSEAIKNTGISRPVFTSLFEKLNRFNGATVKNMGVKGTYINFYDHVLSAFNIQEVE